MVISFGGGGYFCNPFFIGLFTTACVDFLSQTLETEITYSRTVSETSRSQIEHFSFVIAL